MGSRKWKKIAFILCVAFLLVFTFWYGGDSQNLQGFSVSENRKTGSSKATGQNTSGSGEENDGEYAETSGTEQEEDDNIFKQIVMHITRKSSSSETSNNTQNSKKAQKNANRAADKSQKGNKDNGKEKNSSNSSKKKTESGNNNEKNGDNNNSNQNTEGNATNPDSSDANPNTAVTEGYTNNTATDTGTIKCAISISCAVLLDSMDSLPAAKKKLVPSDGILLKTDTVKVKEGSTVFDVLRQATRANNIHLEYSFTPMYKSYYIEGIGNLYEFDSGELSGWMYSVNGEFPGYACSSYKVKNGDEIKWVYTCNLGKDVGDYFEE